MALSGLSGGPTLYSDGEIAPKRLNGGDALTG